MENNQNNIQHHKLNDFKEIISSFTDLLNDENAALNKFDLQRVGQLYEKKSKIVAAYRNMVAYFIKNQSELPAESDPQREELKKLSIDLEALIKQNELLLKTKMQANKMVMDSIVSTAKMTNNSNATSYGSKGKYSPLDNNSNALAVNRTL